MRKGITIAVFVIVVLTAIAGVVALTVQFLGQTTDCEDLERSGEQVDRTTTLLIELGGNTTEWAAAVSDFVVRRLTGATADRPEDAIAVHIALSKGGRIYMASSACLTGRLVLGPDEAERTTFARATEDTRSDMARRFKSETTDQIDVVASALRDEVLGTTFEGRDQQMSFLTLWKEGETSQGELAMISPLVSTVGDCLTPVDSEEVTAQQLVSDCVSSGAMPVIEAERLHIEGFDFLESTAGQIEATDDMIEALRTCGSPEGC